MTCYIYDHKKDLKVRKASSCNKLNRSTRSMFVKYICYISFVTISYSKICAIIQITLYQRFANNDKLKLHFYYNNNT